MKKRQQTQRRIAKIESLGSRMLMAADLSPIGTFETGVFDEGAAEIVAYDAASQRAFFTNADGNSLGILDLSDPTNPTEFGSVDLSPFGDGPNSVAVANGIVAVAIQSDPVTDPGTVAFFDTDGAFLHSVVVGALPDMLTFTPDGSKLLVANEGEPDDGIDPVGSVSVIDVSSGVAAATVQTATFDSLLFGNVLDQSATIPSDENNAREAGIRVFPGVNLANDLEPEYISVSPDGLTARVTLQEANAFAVLDIATATIVELQPLGLKDHSLPGNGIDASDRDNAINIANWPVFGMYMPDAVTSFEIAGVTYYATANEGDDRGEDSRIKDLTLDPTEFPDAAVLQADGNLGRLAVSTIDGDTDGDGDFDKLFAYGARSFTIWDSEGNVVFDSGDQFEQITAAAFPDHFNASNDENDAEGRSDAKGPEPEAITTGVINGRTLVFIGLERIGGIMVYDVTDPISPVFQRYVNNRDFTGDPESGTAGDLGVEDLKFVSGEDSPNGAPLLIAANEVSGTVTIFQISGTFFNDGVLEVIGTNGDDEIKVKNKKHGKIELQIESDGSGERKEHFTGVEQIIIHGVLGDDEIKVDSKVRIDAMLFGGAGDDELHGGGGQNLIDGGAGNDTLRGGNFGDILIGGSGKDKLHGDKRDDVLIGGLLSDDVNRVFAEWQSDLLDVLSLSVVDDGEKDVLKGDQGDDFLFDGLGDRLKDSPSSKHRHDRFWRWFC